MISVCIPWDMFPSEFREPILHARSDSQQCKHFFISPWWIQYWVWYCQVIFCFLFMFEGGRGLVVQWVQKVWWEGYLVRRVVRNIIGREVIRGWRGMERKRKRRRERECGSWCYELVELIWYSIKHCVVCVFVFVFVCVFSLFFTSLFLSPFIHCKLENC